jgi:hypothetical protein
MVCLSHDKCSYESIEGSQLSFRDLSYIIAKSGLQLDFSYKVLLDFKRGLMKAISEKTLYIEEKKKLVDQLYIIKNELKPFIQRLGVVMLDVHVLLQDNRIDSSYFEKKVQKLINLKDILKKISDMTQRVSKKVVV